MTVQSGLLQQYTVTGVEVDGESVQRAPNMSLDELYPLFDSSKLLAKVMVDSLPLAFQQG